jgi:hemolysin activation/secretion protein
MADRRPRRFAALTCVTPLARVVLSLAMVMAAGLASAQQPATPAATPAAPSEPRFDVYEYVIVGNTVLDTESIERAVMPFLGPSRTMNDVQSARAALERAYQARGFQSVGVDVPEQRVQDAVVTLQVVEATVGRLRVRGAEGGGQ